MVAETFYDTMFITLVTRNLLHSVSAPLKSLTPQSMDRLGEGKLLMTVKRGETGVGHNVSL